MGLAGVTNKMYKLEIRSTSNHDLMADGSLNLDESETRREYRTVAAAKTAAESWLTSNKLADNPEEPMWDTGVPGDKVMALAYIESLELTMSIFNVRKLRGYMH